MKLFLECNSQILQLYRNPAVRGRFVRPEQTKNANFAASENLAQFLETCASASARHGMYLSYGTFFTEIFSVFTIVKIP